MSEGISILVPTLNRPHNMTQFAESVNSTTSDYSNIEILFGIHEDDSHSLNKANELKNKCKIQIRDEIIQRYSDGKIHLSFLWNQLYKKAKYPILGFFGDDVIFQTKGWDQEVRKEFLKDSIILLYGNDVYCQKGALATLFFTHKKVHDAVGYYLNENFRRWYMDTWWDNVFRSAKKLKYRPDLLWAHLHPDAFPDKIDDTYRKMETEKNKIPDGKYISSPESALEMKRIVNIIKELRS